MTYFLLLALLFLAIAGTQLRWTYHRKRLLDHGWETVLQRAEQIDFEAVRTVAECYLQPNCNQLRVETDAMWQMVGGLEGLERLRSNAAAILDLAIYAQQWNDVEGAAVAAMIRRDAARLKGAVLKVELASLVGIDFVQGPLHVQEAAAAYYLMRSRLVGLYQNSHVALLPRLEAVL